MLGSSPNAVTVSPNGRRSTSPTPPRTRLRSSMPTSGRDEAVRGFIPTGWYPTAVALDATGDAAVHRQRLRLRIDRPDAADAARAAATRTA